MAFRWWADSGPVLYGGWDFTFLICIAYLNLSLNLLFPFQDGEAFCHVASAAKFAGPVRKSPP